jgi:hypothetical protein
MTLNLLKEFCEKMDHLERGKVKGMILTSVSDGKHEKFKFTQEKLLVGAERLLVWFGFQRVDQPGRVADQRLLVVVPRGLDEALRLFLPHRSAHQWTRTSWWLRVCHLM